MTTNSTYLRSTLLMIPSLSMSISLLRRIPSCHRFKSLLITYNINFKRRQFDRETTTLQKPPWSIPCRLRAWHRRNGQLLFLSPFSLRDLLNQSLLITSNRSSHTKSWFCYRCRGMGCVGIWAVQWGSPEALTFWQHSSHQNSPMFLTLNTETFFVI